MQFKKKRWRNKKANVGSSKTVAKWWNCRSYSVRVGYLLIRSYSKSITSKKKKQRRDKRLWPRKKFLSQIYVSCSHFFLSQIAKSLKICWNGVVFFELACNEFSNHEVRLSKNWCSTLLTFRNLQNGVSPV